MWSDGFDEAAIETLLARKNHIQDPVRMARDTTHFLATVPHCLQNAGVRRVEEIHVRDACACMGLKVDPRMHKVHSALHAEEPQLLQ